MITDVNIATCLLIVFAFGWIGRQALNIKGCRTSVLSRAFIVAVAVPYLLKAGERVRGNEASAIDLIRDFGLLGLLITVIVQGRTKHAQW